MNAAAPGDPHVSLADRAAGAFGWSFLNTALTRLGTLAIGVVLARVLGPSEFGTFAVALVALMAVLSFNELGVSLAIVRWPGDPLEIASTVNTLSLGASSVLFAAMWWSAPALAAALGDAEASGVIRLMAVSVVISGAVAGPAALLQRDFRQRRRFAIDQTVNWLGMGLSLVLALGGLGAWSLAVGRVAGSLVGLVLFLLAVPYRYRLGLDPGVARRLLHFGLPLAGASVIVFAVGYAEQVTVGAVLGATSLAYYVLAFNLASWPVNVVSQPLRSVAPAAFARLQHSEEQMGDAFVSVTRLLAAVALPVCLMLAAVAPDLVQVLYGAEWAPAAPVLRFLAVVAAARIFFELAYDYLVVRQRTAALLLVQGAWLVVLIPVIVVAARPSGLVGVAAGQLAVVSVVVIPLYLLILARSGLRASRLLAGLVVPVLVSAGAAVGVALLGGPIASSWTMCLVAGFVGLGVVSMLLAGQRSLIRHYLVRRPAKVVVTA